MLLRYHRLRSFASFLVLIGAATVDASRHANDVAQINTEGGNYDLEERLIENLSNRLKAEQSANENAQDSHPPFSFDDLPYQVGGPDDPHRPPEPLPYEIDVDEDEEIPQEADNEGDQTPAELATDDDQSPPKETEPTDKNKRMGEPEVPFPPPVPKPLALEAQSDKRASSAHLASHGVGDTVFVAVAAVCVAGSVLLVGAAMIFSRRLHRQYKSAEEAEYPQYGVTGPTKDRSSPGDSKLASSAHLYHYQHTKQQIIAMEQSHIENRDHESEESDAEGEEGDYSVYECPGLAPTGDIEVSNPLFDNNGSNGSQVQANVDQEAADSGPGPAPDRE